MGYKTCDCHFQTCNRLSGRKMLYKLYKLLQPQYYICIMTFIITKNNRTIACLL